MEAARGRLPGGTWGLAPLLVLAAGCAVGRPHVEQTLRGRQPPAPAAAYAVGFPDVLEVSVPAPLGWSGRRPVRIDGRIALGPGDAVRVEGRTVPEVARLIAARAGVPEGQVTVRVGEYRSQLLFLY